jgi:PIN domain nuclease of toxin-antitoxin system
MRLLLDTHIWLWSVLEPERLTSEVIAELEVPTADLWLSPVSVWEALTLAERGRLELRPDPLAWVDDALGRVPINEAPLTFDVAREVASVTLPHRDPADRFLVATARVFDLTLVTADLRLLGAPGVDVLGNR